MWIYAFICLGVGLLGITLVVCLLCKNCFPQWYTSLYPHQSYMIIPVSLVPSPAVDTVSHFSQHFSCPVMLSLCDFNLNFSLRLIILSILSWGYLPSMSLLWEHNVLLVLNFEFFCSYCLRCSGFKLFILCVF